MIIYLVNLTVIEHTKMTFQISSPEYMKIREKWQVFLDDCLHRAVSQNQPDRVVFFLSQGANINQKHYEYNDSLLHIAVEENYTSIVHILIRNGLDVNIPNDIEETSLIKGITNIDMVKLLISYGANINVFRRPWDNTPLSFCAYFNTGDIADVLIKNGADMYKTNDDGLSLITLSMFENGDKCDFIRVMLNNGYEIDHPADEEGGTGLHISCKELFPKVLQLLLTYGANINKQNYEGLTPLHDVISTFMRAITKPPEMYDTKYPSYVQKLFRMALYLIHKGANIWIKDNIGHTPLEFLPINKWRHYMASFYLTKYYGNNDLYFRHIPRDICWYLAWFF